MAIATCQHFHRMEEIIERLNTEIEAEDGLLPPISFENLAWGNFVSNAAIQPRLVVRMKKLLNELRPQSLRQQVYMTAEVLAEDDIINLKTKWVILGKLFGTTGDNARSMYRNYLDRSPTPSPGRRPLLSEPRIRELVREVATRAAQKDPMTRREIMQYIYQRWGVEISKRTVNRMIKTRPELSSCVALPMEKARAEVTRAELEEFYRQLAANIEGVLPESIVNLDEVGFSRKSRAAPLSCVIPSELEGCRIEYIPREDTDSTFTILAAVTLVGESLLPYIVAPVKSLPNEVLVNTTWVDRDCVLDFNRSGFANGMIVNQWYAKVFTPWLEKHRFTVKKGNIPVVLICDGFSGHSSDELRSLTARDNVRLIFLPPHSSHLTQALDRYVFAGMKRSYGNAVPDAEIVDRNGRKINRMLKAFYSSCTSPFTIRASWRDVGITGLHDAEGRSLGVEINGEKVITQHVELAPGRNYQRKRQDICQDHLANRIQLQRKNQGLCVFCGKPRGPETPEEEEQVRDAPRKVRIRFYCDCTGRTIP